MIRLTEKEIKEAVGIAKWQGLNFEATKTDCEGIAKAQLKKVVKELGGYIVFEGNRQVDLEIPEDNWEALLKEIEE